MSENPSHGVVEVKGMHAGMYASDHGIAPQAVGPAHVHASAHQGMHQFPGQIEEALGGGNSAGGAQMQMYGQEQEHEVHGGSGGERMEEGHDVDVDGGVMEVGLPQDADTGAMGVMVAPGMGNQLTLSFQGEVYVFDSVSPEKVQAVLLLLGGRELTSGINSFPSSQQNNRRSNFPQRVASLMRFREKRKERNFDKKIRYTVRKEVAQRMQRNKGQFTSSKTKPEDANLSIASWDATQQWGSVENQSQAASACHHCGISALSTPMMRRGPDGPRTLCNACGLMWANKGTLRDLSRSASIHNKNTACESAVVNEGNEANGDPLPVITANGHESSS